MEHEQLLADTFDEHGGDALHGDGNVASLRYEVGTVPADDDVIYVVVEGETSSPRLHG